MHCINTKCEYHRQINEEVHYCPFNKCICKDRKTIAKAISEIYKQDKITARQYKELELLKEMYHSIESG